MRCMLSGARLAAEDLTPGAGIYSALHADNSMLAVDTASMPSFMPSSELQAATCDHLSAAIGNSLPG